MKKILYITSLFDQKANSAVIRNNSLVKGLLEKGYDIEVLTVKWPTHFVSPFFKKELDIKVYRTDINMPDIFKSNKIKDLPFPLWTKLKEIVKQIIFFPDISRKWPKYINENDFTDYDYIISSSDGKTSHFVGEKIREKTGLPWLQIWGDPWADDVNLLWFSKKRANYNEKKMLSKADKVVYVSEPTLNRMAEKFPELSHKFYFVPRGYYSEAKKVAEKKQEYNIMYAGTLGSLGRNITELLQVIEKHNKNGEIKINIDFFGKLPDDQRAKLNTYSSITIHGVKDFEEIAEEYKTKNALLFIANSAGSTQIPGKLYDYMGTNLPIICLVSNKGDAISKTLESLNRCLIIENNADAIEASYNIMLDELHKEAKIMTEYAPANIARRIVDIINL